MSIFHHQVRTTFFSRGLYTTKYLNTDKYSSIIPFLTVRDLKSEREKFDGILDVRTPAEFKEDRVPGAVNIPVLSDEERVVIGTEYSRNKFEARRHGAALISRNISDHLLHHFADKPPSYRPLIYCW